MLKIRVDDRIRLVQQPHHAQVSGYLAAHWGGNNGFARPGSYPGATDPAAWREEVVLAVAEHDNGWWEWEAMPQISERDGLPVGLGESAGRAGEDDELAPWLANGFERWRAGVERLSGPHPYGALLISLHAFFLYAIDFEDLVPAQERRLRHFLFGGGDAPSLVGDRPAARLFLDEQLRVQEELKRRLAADPGMAAAVQPEHLEPHLRLLQLGDAMSLFLGLDDRDDRELHDVPRASWDDRVTLAWHRIDERTYRVGPFPFDRDPLPVHMPARVVPAGERSDTPLALLHGTPIETLAFQLVS